MLKTRIQTALVLVATLLVVLFWLPPGAGVGFLAALVLLGAWEWASLVGIEDSTGRLLYALLTAVLCGVAWDNTNQTHQWLALMSAAAGWWVIAFLWIAFRPQMVNRLSAAVAGLLVLVPAFVGLGRLVRIETPALHGTWFVLFLLVLVWAADIGAYFAGRRFGRLKLAPRVSPNKTWEGVLGGLAAGLVVAVAGAVFFGLPAAAFVALCAAVVLASIVGDLTESMFKRFAGLKDSGSVFPGHGGVLDRIDSVTAAVPFFLLGLGWLGIVA